MSQLLDDFRRAVDAFNACQKAADYQNLTLYSDTNARISEVDPPHTAHTKRGVVINYLGTTHHDFCLDFGLTIARSSKDQRTPIMRRKLRLRAGYLF
jgi:hypothetical protein